MKLNLKLYEKLRKYTSTRISKKYIYIESIILPSYFMHIHKEFGKYHAQWTVTTTVMVYNDHFWGGK